MDTSSLNEVPNGVQQEGVPPAQADVKVDAGIGKQPEKPAEAAPAFDWTKDERYERMWKKDPNLMYKSIKSGDELIEKEYRPLKKRAEELTQIVAQYGYEPTAESIKGAFDKLKSWEDPENEIRKRGDLVTAFYDNPLYKEKVATFFEDLRRQELQRRYPNMSDEQIQRDLERDRKIEELEAKERQRDEMLAKQKEQENHNRLLSEIDKGWQRIITEYSSIGMPMTDEIKGKLIDECIKDDVDPRFMYYKFSEMFKDEIEKHRHAKSESDFVRKAERSRKQGIIPAGSSLAKSSDKGQKKGLADSIRDRLGIK